MIVSIPRTDLLTNSLAAKAAVARVNLVTVCLFYFEREQTLTLTLAADLEVLFVFLNHARATDEPSPPTSTGTVVLFYIKFEQVYSISSLNR